MLKHRKGKLLKTGAVELENVSIKKIAVSVKFDENELDSLLSSFKGDANPKRSK